MPPPTPRKSNMCVVLSTTSFDTVLGALSWNQLHSPNARQRTERLCIGSLGWFVQQIQPNYRNGSTLPISHPRTLPHVVRCCDYSQCAHSSCPEPWHYPPVSPDKIWTYSSDELVVLIEIGNFASSTDPVWVKVHDELLREVSSLGGLGMKMLTLDSKTYLYSEDRGLQVPMVLGHDYIPHILPAALPLRCPPPPLPCPPAALPPNWGWQGRHALACGRVQVCSLIVAGYKCARWECLW